MEEVEMVVEEGILRCSGSKKMGFDGGGSGKRSGRDNLSTAIDMIVESRRAGEEEIFGGESDDD